MTFLWRLVELGRPEIMFRALLTSGSTAFLAGAAAPEWGRAVAIAALLVAGVYAVDDWYDVEIDRQSRPNRPLPSGSVSHGLAIPYACIAFFGALTIALFANVAASVLAAAVASGSFIVCSHQWGHRPNPFQHHWVLRSISSTLFVSAFLVLGVIMGRNITTGVLLFVATLAIPHLGGRIVGDYFDRNGDEKVGIRTLPVVHGVSALNIGLSVLLVSALLMPLPGFFGFGAVYRILATLLSLVIVILLFLMWRRPAKLEKYRRHFSWIMAAIIVIALVDRVVKLH